MINGLLPFKRGVSFSNPTKRWKKARTALLEVLAPPRVNGFAEILSYESDCLVEQLLMRTEQQGQLDPLPILNAAAMNVVLTIAYDHRVESVDDPFFKVPCIMCGTQIFIDLSPLYRRL